jgi:hypothetical protein
MTNKKPQDRLGALMRDIEKLVKRVRTEVRKRAKGMGAAKNVQSALEQVRKRAVAAVAQAEKWAHELRKELEGPPKKAAPKRAKARRRRKKAAAPSAAA